MYFLSSFHFQKAKSVHNYEYLGIELDTELSDDKNIQKAYLHGRASKCGRREF